MLDKTSYKLLKSLYKHSFLSYNECNSICHTYENSECNQNEYALHLIHLGYVTRHDSGKLGEFNSAIYDGYEITLEGRGYIDDKREKFWTFLIPYVITTLIAIIALFIAA